MKRTTIYLDPETEVQLKLEALRTKQTMAEIIREALQSHLRRRAAELPPGLAEFESGYTDTADRAEELLDDLNFGRKS